VANTTNVFQVCNDEEKFSATVKRGYEKVPLAKCGDKWKALPAIVFGRSPFLQALLVVLGYCSLLKPADDFVGGVSDGVSGFIHELPFYELVKTDCIHLP